MPLLSRRKKVELTDESIRAMIREEIIKAETMGNYDGRLRVLEKESVVSIGRLDDHDTRLKVMDENARRGFSLISRIIDELKKAVV